MATEEPDKDIALVANPSAFTSFEHLLCLHKSRLASRIVSSVDLDALAVIFELGDEGSGAKLGVHGGEGASDAPEHRREGCANAKRNSLGKLLQASLDQGWNDAAEVRVTRSNLAEVPYRQQVKSEEQTQRGDRLTERGAEHSPASPSARVFLGQSSLSPLLDWQASLCAPRESLSTLLRDLKEPPA